MLPENIVFDVYALAYDVYKRANRTVFNGARTLLIDANIQICFLQFAVRHVAYVRNRVKHLIVGDYPLNIITES